jgi:hypothetical protein
VGAMAVNARTLAVATIWMSVAAASVCMSEEVRRVCGASSAIKSDMRFNVLGN